MLQKILSRKRNVCGTILFWLPPYSHATATYSLGKEEESVVRHGCLKIWNTCWNWKQSCPCWITIQFWILFRNVLCEKIGLYFFRRIKIHSLVLRYKSSKSNFILLNKPKLEDNLSIKLIGQYISFLSKNTQFEVVIWSFYYWKKNFI